MSASSFRSYVFPTGDSTSGIIYRCLYNLGYQPEMAEETTCVEGCSGNVVIFCGLSDLGDLLDQEEAAGFAAPRSRIILVMARAEIADAYPLLPYCDGMVFTDLGYERLDSAVELALDGYCSFPSRDDDLAMPQGLPDPFDTLDLSLAGH